MLFRRKPRQPDLENGSLRMFKRNILAIADIHGNKLDLPDCDPDLVLLLGDIPFQIVDKLDKFFRCPKLGVLGNHDGLDFFEGTSILNVHGQVVEVEGIRFGGFGGAPCYSAKPYGQYTEDEVRAFVDGLGYVGSFLAHASP